MSEQIEEIYSENKRCVGGVNTSLEATLDSQYNQGLQEGIALGLEAGEPKWVKVEDGLPVAVGKMWRSEWVNTNIGADFYDYILRDWSIERNRSGRVRRKVIVWQHLPQFEQEG